MNKLKRFLSKRRSTRHYASPTSSLSVPAPNPAASSASNRIVEAISAESLCPSRLEQLPFDVRHQVLLAVDAVEDLRVLVNASPTFHQQYLLNRAFWLWRCLQLEMGHVLIDACTANLCNKSSFRRERTRQQVRRFIEAYHQRRSMATDTLSTLPSIEEVICVAAFYSSTIRPLLQQFTAWTRINLEALSMPDQISKTEQVRILRGLYRFQIFCNLFGGVQGDVGPSLDANERLGLFLGEYEPWEVEEVICINTFADAKYHSVFDEVEGDLHPDNPRFDSERRDIHTPDGAFRLDNYAEREWHKNGMISLGLSLLSAMFKVQDHSKLVEMTSANMVSIGENWIAETTDSYTQGRRRQSGHSDRDRGQDRRDKVSFDGDRDDSPPLAWVTIWQETYSNIYGFCIPEPLRSWGYVMWDASRLVDSGAIDVLDQQWKAMYAGDDDEMDDPRDDL